MRKFKLKDIWGYGWVITGFIVSSIITIVFLSLTIYLFLSSYNGGAIVLKEKLATILILDVILLIVLIIFILTYALIFSPFTNKEGQVVDVKILEISIFNNMYGVALIDGKEYDVKITYLSAAHFLTFLLMFKEGEYCRCFIRNKDLNKEKVKAILYKY